MCSSARIPTSAPAAPDGLRDVPNAAILAANYIAQRIKHVYPLPYGPPTASRWRPIRCAHEFIAVPRDVIDRGVTIMDIAKNLIDRGFHPPTVHWPVHDCLMIEPTETESKATLDAFTDALLEIAEQSEQRVEQLSKPPYANPSAASMKSARPENRYCAGHQY